MTADQKVECKGGGHERLWAWFGLSRASFMVLPRVLMHEMSDEWQDKMETLLREYEDEFPNQSHLPSTRIQAVREHKLVKWPEWLLRYRHPNRDEISQCKS